MRAGSRAAACALLLAVAPLRGQEPGAVADSARAVQAGAAAARGELVTAYGLAGFVAAPVSLGALAYLRNGDDVPIGFVVAPAALVLVGARASRRDRNLPAGLQEHLAGESPAYRAAFTRSYAETLRSRRLKAMGIGALLGIMTSVVLLSTIDYT